MRERSPLPGDVYEIRGPSMQKECVSTAQFDDVPEQHLLLDVPAFHPCSLFALEKSHPGQRPPLIGLRRAPRRNLPGFGAAVDLVKRCSETRFRLGCELRGKGSRCAKKEVRLGEVVCLGKQHSQMDGRGYETARSRQCLEFGADVCGEKGPSAMHSEAALHHHQDGRLQAVHVLM